MYSQEATSGAIDAATREIEARNRDLKSYIRGTNDCFAFLLLYEAFLRGSKSLSKDMAAIKYRDHKEFLGCTNLLELATQLGFKVVPDRVPQSGDVCYEERRGIGTAMVAREGYWLAPTERLKGVREVRKTLFKELRPQFLARPVYI